jgi:hypothetical protein
VWAAQGITDPDTQWSKILKWRLRQSPAYSEMFMTRYAKATGNVMMQKVLRLQAEQQMTKQGVPGMDAGVPTSMLRRPGEGSGAGGPTAAQSALGGVVAGGMGTASRMADAEAQLQVNQGAA